MGFDWKIKMGKICFLDVHTYWSDESPERYERGAGHSGERSPK